MNKGRRERNWRSAGAWRQIVERYERRDVSADEFCRREGIASSSLWKWRRRLNGGAKELVRASFVEVDPAPGQRIGSAVELRFPSGLVLRVLGG